MHAPGRFAVYGALGVATEVAFTTIRSGRPKTHPWSLVMYGLAQPLWEPVHDRLRGRAAPLRGAAYGLGFLGVEYACGRLLRATRGAATWDYSYARWHVDGLIRPDFLPLWAIYGLGLEDVHDRLTGR